MAKAKFVKEQREVEDQHEQQEQVADSTKGKGKGTEHHQLSSGSSDEGDFSLEELKKMEDAIKFSVALSGNRVLSAKLRRRIVMKEQLEQQEEQQEQQQQQEEEAQQTKQTKTKQITQSINQTIRTRSST